MKNLITVQTTVDVPVEKVWNFWNTPEHIKGWAFAADDWEAVPEYNNLHVGGKFKTRMQAKDGSAGFDFTGTYTKIKANELIEYIFNDKRHVKVVFEETSHGTKIIENFEPENENPEEMQRAGWQAFLDNFKKYVEGK